MIVRDEKRRKVKKQEEKDKELKNILCGALVDLRGSKLRARMIIESNSKINGHLSRI